jgi:hypothetical protein
LCVKKSMHWDVIYKYDYVIRLHKQINKGKHLIHNNFQLTEWHLKYVAYRMSHFCHRMRVPKHLIIREHMEKQQFTQKTWLGQVIDAYFSPNMNNYLLSISLAVAYYGIPPPMVNNLSTQSRKCGNRIHLFMFHILRSFTFHIASNITFFGNVLCHRYS